MDPDLINMLKSIGSIAAYPLFIIGAFFSKRFIHRIDNIENKVSLLDKFQAVHKNQLDNIEQDIKHINTKLDKIIDKL